MRPSGGNRIIGAHTWPYWRDDLAATLSGITTFFAKAPELPRAA